MYSPSIRYGSLRDNIIRWRCFLRCNVADLTPFKEPRKLVKLTGSPEEFNDMNIRIARTVNVWEARRKMCGLTTKKSDLFYRNWGFKV